MAKTLNARLFEEVGATEVTGANIDSLLEPNGRYVGLRAKTWQRTMAGLDESARASLEYLLGPIDLVSFARVAPVVVQTAEAIHSEVKGTLEFRGQSYDEPMQRKVHELMNGLAIDFFVWTQAS